MCRTATGDEYTIITSRAGVPNISVSMQKKAKKTKNNNNLYRSTAKKNIKKREKSTMVNIFVINIANEKAQERQLTIGFNGINTLVCHNVIWVSCVKLLCVCSYCDPRYHMISIQYMYIA